jgi:hypothetical protein
MKKWLLVALLAVVVYGEGEPTGPLNSINQWRDTIWVDSTSVVWSDIFWQDNGGEKCLLVTLDDTSQAGVADDSASIKLELYQVFADNAQYRRDFKNAWVLPSRAFPDSTSWPYSSSFALFDSLDILDMDSTAMWVRTATPVIKRYGNRIDTLGYYYDTQLDSAVTDGSKAYAYVPIVPDASPGLAFKITGLARGAKATSVQCVLTMWQILSEKVSEK